ncbi:MAG: hypothetical protein RLZZ387_4255, partial [Chloroflexota bacterium]
MMAGASPFFLEGPVAKTVLRQAAGGCFDIHELLRQYSAGRGRA